MSTNAVQVDIRLTLGLKALGCHPIESTSPFKVVVSDVVINLHPYSVDGNVWDSTVAVHGKAEVQADTPA